MTDREAMDNIGEKATYTDIKKFIHNKYDEVNDNTITCQIIVCTVNHNTRIHYPENKKPKINNKTLKLYVNDNGNDGIEFKTNIGIIDILAKDENDSFSSD